MRIHLTLDIERRRPEPYDYREVDMASDHERAGSQRIGFSARPGTDEPEPEWEERR